MYEQIADPQIANIYRTLGVRISNDNRAVPTANAAYSNQTDEIILRPGETYQGHYDAAVLLHELVHWTKTRVGRRHADTPRGYTYEEIVANFGAFRLIDKLGYGREAIDAVNQNISQYVERWALIEPQTLEPTLERAARDGIKSADWILSKIGKLPQQAAA